MPPPVDTHELAKLDDPTRTVKVGCKGLKRNMQVALSWVADQLQAGYQFDIGDTADYKNLAWRVVQDRPHEIGVYDKRNNNRITNVSNVFEMANFCDAGCYFKGRKFASRLKSLEYGNTKPMREIMSRP